VGRDIFKDPKTDDGTKKSAKGLMQVYRDPATGKLALKDQCSWEEEAQGELKPAFRDGKLLVGWTLAEIRQRVRENL
jgi:nicotinamide phosphoribosyltransferase